MAKTQVSRPKALLSAVIVVGTVAGVFLVQNFGRLGFSATWPAVVMAVGLSLALSGFLELGLTVFGIFGIWLLANVGVIAPVSKSWPFFLVWIILVVLLGYVRGRTGSGRKSVS